jgi:hypothetical protein
MNSTYPSAFDALPDSVKAMVATTIVTGIEPLFSLGWSDGDIAQLIAHFTDGIGKPYVGCDQAGVLTDLAQRRADWEAKKKCGNGHASGTDNGAVGQEAEEESDAGTDASAVLEPNLADINKHLYAIFSPDFAKDHPEAWIEIATADPTAGKDKKGKDLTGPRAARHFSVFELEKAAAYAVRMNKQGRNVYVGMALRQGETGPSGRATKENVITGSRGWADFDKEGDHTRIISFLQQRGLHVAETILTGTIPHPRLQVFFKLTGPVTPEQLEAVNEAMKTSLGGNGDGVQNCDRVMRLAGTVSYPPPKKVARGYVPELTRLSPHPKTQMAYRPEVLIGLLTNAPSVAGPGARPNVTAGGANSGDAGDGKFWRKVNDMALANLSSWVPEIFPDAEFQKGTGAYRIHAASLKRELDEDLSIHPKGITDWGIDDQGEKGEKAGRHTAIDIVIGHGGAADPRQAAFWLCERCGVDPASLGWKAGGTANNEVSREIERLAKLSRADYEAERKTAAKALNFRAKVLDSLVGQMRENKEETLSRIEQLNTEYALVLAGNKAAVMKFDEPTKFRLLQTSAFTTWFGNQFLNGEPLGAYWMTHAERRQYSGIEFAPPGSAPHPNFYNLWQGFTCKPVKGCCSKFLAHLKDNAANGDEATYLWIFGWWAQIFQHPSVKTGTSLGFRGPFGAGKTKIGEVFGSLIGDHYQPVSRSGHITGQFNSHMAALLVLHADEAFWAGDKDSVGVLRDLVTGLQHLLEFKGVDKIRMKNYIRLFITGNPDWMVPAGFKERRWAIFDIGEDKVQDNDYFAAIDEEMNNGGREALLYELLNFDLKQVNLRIIPKTAALLDQQIASMTPEETWWFETLMRGALPSIPRGLLGTSLDTNVCLKDDLFETYILHAKMQGASRRAIETRIGMFLKKQLGAKLTLPRPFVGSPPKQIRCYKLPPLKECREMFDKQLGQQVDWGSAKWQTEEWQQNDDWRDALAKVIRTQSSSPFG